MNDVLSTLPFGNMAERVEISGEDLLAALTNSVSLHQPDNPAEASGRFLQVSGEIETHAHAMRSKTCSQDRRHN